MRRTWVFCALGLVIMGCRREPAEESPGGSGRPSDSSSAVRNTASGTPGTAPSAPDRPLGVDARDDPDAPHAIPHSDQLMDWVKVHAVEVREPQTIAEIIDDERIISLIRLFPLNRVARTVYRKKDTLADVIYIEAQSPVDAYGCYSVATTTQGEFHRADGSVRTVEPLDARDPSGTGRLQAAWQGNACVLVRCRPAESENTDDIESCEPVLSKIVFEIPSRDPPLLLFAVPADYRDQSDFWCVRTTRALPTDAHAVFAELQPDLMDNRLGLNGQALLHLAAVHVDEDASDNLIWVAEYPQPEAALAAYQRYRAALEANEVSIDTHTLVIEPVGRLMAGSWTVGQESIQRLLPSLKEMLKIE